MAKIWAFDNEHILREAIIEPKEQSNDIVEEEISPSSLSYSFTLGRYKITGTAKLVRSIDNAPVSVWSPHIQYQCSPVLDSQYGTSLKDDKIIEFIETNLESAQVSSTEEITRDIELSTDIELYSILKLVSVDDSSNIVYITFDGISICDTDQTNNSVHIRSCIDEIDKLINRDIEYNIYTASNEHIGVFKDSLLYKGYLVEVVDNTESQFNTYRNLNYFLTHRGLAYAYKTSDNEMGGTDDVIWEANHVVRDSLLRIQRDAIQNERGIWNGVRLTKEDGTPYKVPYKNIFNEYVYNDLQYRHRYLNSLYHQLFLMSNPKSIVGDMKDRRSDLRKNRDLRRNTRNGAKPLFYTGYRAGVDLRPIDEDIFNGNIKNEEDWEDVIRRMVQGEALARVGRTLLGTDGSIITSIQTNTDVDIPNFKGIGTYTNPVKDMGNVKATIQMQVIFEDAQAVNDQLRDIIAQFMVSPVLPIWNKVATSTLQPVNRFLELYTEQYSYDFRRPSKYLEDTDIIHYDIVNTGTNQGAIQDLVYDDAYARVPMNVVLYDINTQTVPQAPETIVANFTFMVNIIPQRYDLDTYYFKTTDALYRYHEWEEEVSKILDGVSPKLKAAAFMLRGITFESAANENLLERILYDEIDQVNYNEYIKYKPRISDLITELMGQSVVPFKIPKEPLDPNEDLVRDVMLSEPYNILVNRILLGADYDLISGNVMSIVNGVGSIPMTPYLGDNKEPFRITYSMIDFDGPRLLEIINSRFYSTFGLASGDDPIEQRRSLAQTIRSKLYSYFSNPNRFEGFRATRKTSPPVTNNQYVESIYIHGTAIRKSESDSSIEAIQDKFWQLHLYDNEYVIDLIKHLVFYELIDGLMGVGMFLRKYRPYIPGNKNSIRSVLKSILTKYKYHYEQGMEINQQELYNNMQAIEKEIDDYLSEIGLLRSVHDPTDEEDDFIKTSYIEADGSISRITVVEAIYKFLMEDKYNDPDLNNQQIDASQKALIRAVGLESVNNKLQDPAFDATCIMKIDEYFDSLAFNNDTTQATKNRFISNLVGIVETIRVLYSRVKSLLVKYGLSYRDVVAQKGFGRERGIADNEVAYSPNNGAIIERININLKTTENIPFGISGVQGITYTPISGPEGNVEVNFVVTENERLFELAGIFIPFSVADVFYGMLYQSKGIRVSNIPNILTPSEELRERETSYLSEIQLSGPASGQDKYDERFWLNKNRMESMRSYFYDQEVLRGLGFEIGEDKLVWNNRFEEPIRIKHSLVNSHGIETFILRNIYVSNIQGSPGAFNVSMTFKTVDYSFRPKRALTLEKSKPDIKNTNLLLSFIGAHAIADRKEGFTGIYSDTGVNSNAYNQQLLSSIRTLEENNNQYIRDRMDGISNPELSKQYLEQFNSTNLKGLFDIPVTYIKAGNIANDMMRGGLLALYSLAVMRIYIEDYVQNPTSRFGSSVSSLFESKSFELNGTNVEVPAFLERMLTQRVGYYFKAPDKILGIIPPELLVGMGDSIGQVVFRGLVKGLGSGRKKGLFGKGPIGRLLRRNKSASQSTGRLGGLKAAMGSKKAPGGSLIANAITTLTIFAEFTALNFLRQTPAGREESFQYTTNDGRIRRYYSVDDAVFDILLRDYNIDLINDKDIFEPPNRENTLTLITQVINNIEVIGNPSIMIEMPRLCMMMAPLFEQWLLDLYRRPIEDRSNRIKLIAKLALDLVLPFTESEDFTITYQWGLNYQDDELPDVGVIQSFFSGRVVAATCANNGSNNWLCSEVGDQKVRYGLSLLLMENETEDRYSYNNILDTAGSKLEKTVDDLRTGGTGFWDRYNDISYIDTIIENNNIDYNVASKGFARYLHTNAAYMAVRDAISCCDSLARTGMGGLIDTVSTAILYPNEISQSIDGMVVGNNYHLLAGHLTYMLSTVGDDIVTEAEARGLEPDQMADLIIAEAVNSGKLERQRIEGNERRSEDPYGNVEASDPDTFNIMMSNVGQLSLQCRRIVNNVRNLNINDKTANGEDVDAVGMMVMVDQLSALFAGYYESELFQDIFDVLNILMHAGSDEILRMMLQKDSEQVKTWLSVKGFGKSLKKAASSAVTDNASVYIGIAVATAISELVKLIAKKIGSKLLSGILGIIDIITSVYVLFLRITTAIKTSLGAILQLAGLGEKLSFMSNISYLRYGLLTLVRISNYLSIQDLANIAENYNNAYRYLIPLKNERIIINEDGNREYSWTMQGGIHIPLPIMEIVRRGNRSQFDDNGSAINFLPIVRINIGGNSKVLNPYFHVYTGTSVLKRLSESISNMYDMVSSYYVDNDESYNGFVNREIVEKQGQIVDDQMTELRSSSKTMLSDISTDSDFQLIINSAGVFEQLNQILIALSNNNINLLKNEEIDKVIEGLYSQATAEAGDQTWYSPSGRPIVTRINGLINLLRRSKRMNEFVRQELRQKDTIAWYEYSKGIVFSDYGVYGEFGRDIVKAKLLETMRDLKQEDVLSMVGRSVPTYKLYFVEQDTNEWILYDDLYSYSSVESLIWYHPKDHPVGVANIRVSNFNNQLTNVLAEKFNRESIYEVDSNPNAPLSGILLRPGCKIMIRAGYTPILTEEDTVFVGQITNIRPSQDAGIQVLDIEAQTYGAILDETIAKNRPIRMKFPIINALYTYGRIAKRIVKNIPGRELGSFEYYTDSLELIEAADVNPFRTGVIARVIKGVKDAFRSVKSITQLDLLAALGSDEAIEFLERDAPLTDRRFDNIRITEDITKAGFGKLFRMRLWSKLNRWVVFNESSWEALTDLSLMIPNHVVAVRPYELRNTLILTSLIDGYYKTRDTYKPGSYLYTGIIEELHQNSSDYGRASGYLKKKFDQLYNLDKRRFVAMAFVFNDFLQRILRAYSEDPDTINTRLESTSTKEASDVIVKAFHDVYETLIDRTKQTKDEIFSSSKHLANILLGVTTGGNYSRLTYGNIMLGMTAGELDTFASTYAELLGPESSIRREMDNGLLEYEKTLASVAGLKFDPNSDYVYEPDNKTSFRSKLRHRRRARFDNLSESVGEGARAAIGSIIEPLEDSEINEQYEAELLSAEGKKRIRHMQKLGVIWGVAAQGFIKWLLQIAYGNSPQHRKIQNVYFKTSYSHILSNELGLQEGYNAVNIKMPKLKSIPKFSRASLSQIRSFSRGDIDDFQEYGMVLNDSIERHKIKIKDYYHKNCNAIRAVGTHGYAAVASNLLSREANKFYTGKIVLGYDPRIMPYDLIMLYDEVRDMWGQVQVEDVTNVVDKNLGYYTVITPGLPAYSDVRIGNITPWDYHRPWVLARIVGVVTILIGLHYLKKGVTQLTGWFARSRIGVNSSVLQTIKLTSARISAFTRSRLSISYFLSAGASKIIGRAIVKSGTDMTDGFMLRAINDLYKTASNFSKAKKNLFNYYMWETLASAQSWKNANTYLMRVFKDADILYEPIATQLTNSINQIRSLNVSNAVKNEMIEALQTNTTLAAFKEATGEFFGVVQRDRGLLLSDIFNSTKTGRSAFDELQSIIKRQSGSVGSDAEWVMSAATESKYAKELINIHFRKALVDRGLSEQAINGLVDNMLIGELGSTGATLSTKYNQMTLSAMGGVVGEHVMSLGRILDDIANDVSTDVLNVEAFKDAMKSAYRGMFLLNAVRRKRTKLPNSPLLRYKFGARFSQRMFRKDIPSLTAPRLAFMDAGISLGTALAIKELKGLFGPNYETMEFLMKTYKSIRSFLDEDYVSETDTYSEAVTLSGIFYKGQPYISNVDGMMKGSIAGQPGSGTAFTRRINHMRDTFERELQDRFIRTIRRAEYEVQDAIDKQITDIQGLL